MAAIEEHSQQCEWLSLAGILQLFYSINSLVITHSNLADIIELCSYLC
jgi:hypothetical protein